MPKGSGKVLSQNKKANHDYFIEETYVWLPLNKTFNNKVTTQLYMIKMIYLIT